MYSKTPVHEDDMKRAWVSSEACHWLGWAVRATRIGKIKWKWKTCWGNNNLQHQQSSRQKVIGYTMMWSHTLANTSNIVQVIFMCLEAFSRHRLPNHFPKPFAGIVLTCSTLCRPPEPKSNLCRDQLKDHMTGPCLDSTCFGYATDFFLVQLSLHWHLLSQ